MRERAGRGSGGLERTGDSEGREINQAEMYGSRTEIYPETINNAQKRPLLEYEIETLPAGEIETCVSL